MKTRDSEQGERRRKVRQPSSTCHSKQTFCTRDAEPRVRHLQTTWSRISARMTPCAWAAGWLTGKTLWGDGDKSRGGYDPTVSKSTRTVRTVPCFPAITKSIRLAKRGYHPLRSRLSEWRAIKGGSMHGAAPLPSYLRTVTLSPPRVKRDQARAQGSRPWLVRKRIRRRASRRSVVLLSAVVSRS